MNKELLKQQIEKAKYAYYNTDTPIMTDSEYDFLIKQYGEEPSVGAEVIDSIKKIEIKDRPMLSLDKVHDVSEIESFQKKKELIASIKCDGLSVRLIYENGILIGANTRGNGIVGGDIYTHTFYIQNIPKKISKTGRFVIDGEVIIFEKDFDSINFKNQRNAAAGALALLDMNEVKNRKLSFIAWDVIISNKEYLSYSEKLKDASLLGFNVVPWIEVEDIQSSIDYCLNEAKTKGYPCDGVVFKYNDIEYGDMLGSTAHHFKNAVAWKNKDETYTTYLNDIEWSMGKTGVFTPVAIFAPVEIDGTRVSRASLHNVSIMQETLGECPYEGEPLEIIKSNMIIPQVYLAGPKYSYQEVIDKGLTPKNHILQYCPVCKEKIEYIEENNIIRAYCTNPQCDGKLINKLDHFCSKKGLDIKGLSKTTLEKLMDWGWITSLPSIFMLENHKAAWINKTGFGEKSVEKILNSIKEASVCSLDRFICALSIPYVGEVASKAIFKKFKIYENFRDAIKNDKKQFYNIPGFGETIIENILNFDYIDADYIFRNYITEPEPNSNITNTNKLNNKIFAITGKTQLVKNRMELKELITKNGGKATDSISSKINYLICNDKDSNSVKMQKAKSLNIQIISEQEFLDLIS